MDLSKRQRLLTCSLALAAAACAHTQAGAGKPRIPTRNLSDAAAGFSLDVPADQDFRPGTGRDNIVAQTSTGVRLRVFPEHFAKTPNEADCWERLLVEHVPAELKERPTTPDGLANVAKTGLELEGRKLFLAVRPRGNHCVVLVVEGTPEPATRIAQVALDSLRVSEPSAAMQRKLLLDAGIELRRLGHPEAALDRFEDAFSQGEMSPRALAAAGALAFQVGGDRLPLAVAWLEPVVSVPPEIAFPDAFPPQAQAFHAEALMHLGLAYAQLSMHDKAIARLAEAAVRVPEDAVITYNFACGLALAGETEDALEQLRAAVVLDPALAAHARTDADLTSLRGTPEWSAIVGERASATDAAR